MFRPSSFERYIATSACFRSSSGSSESMTPAIWEGSPPVTRIWLGVIPSARSERLTSLAFKWYVIHLGDYQKTYGAIGGVLVTLLWFYFSNLAILLGAQLDATITHETIRLESAGSTGTAG